MPSSASARMNDAPYSCMEISPRSHHCYVLSSRRRHTRLQGDWSSDVCSSDLSCGSEANGNSLRCSLDNCVSHTPYGPYQLLFERIIDLDAQMADVDIDNVCNAVEKIGRASCRERV